MTKKLDVSSDLPAFESKLRDVNYYGDLTKIILDKLHDDALRQVNDIKKLEDIKYKNNQLFEKYNNDSIFVYGSSVHQYLKKYLEKELKLDSRSWSGRKRSGYAYSVSPSQLQNIPLFEQESVAIVGETIYIKVKDEDRILTGDVMKYIANGMEELTTYSGNKMPLGAVYVLGESEEKTQKGSYRFSMEGGESLRISTSNNNVIPNTMSARGYDVLPNKNKLSANNAIAVLKEDRLEFFQLNTEDSHEKNVKAIPYEFFGLKHVDYSRHGKLVEGFLDRNRNFIVGIFETGGTKSLKILRIDQEATLMDEYENIMSLEGMEHADVACYDNDNNLRLVDGNFENYDLYTREEIFTSKVSKFEGSEVEGGCTDFPTLFKSDDFKRGLLYILGESNSLVDKAQITDVISRIHNGDLVLRNELDNLLLILDPAARYNAGLIEKANRIIKTLEGKRRDPLWDLLQDPKEVLQAYTQYLETFENIVDADSIKAYGHDLRLIKQGELVGLYIVGKDTHEVMYEIGDHDLAVNKKKEQYEITVIQGEEIQITTYIDGTGITKKTYSNDKYTSTPTLKDGIGVVSFKTGGKQFVYEKANKFEEFDMEPFDSYSEVGGFKLIVRKSQSDAPYTLLTLQKDGTHKESRSFGENTLDKKGIRKFDKGNVALAKVNDSEILVLVLNQETNEFKILEVVLSASDNRSEIQKNFVKKGRFELSRPSTGGVTLKSTLSVGEQGNVIHSPTMKEIYFSEYGVGLVGKNIDDNIILYTISQKGYEKLYEGDYITVVNTLQGKERKNVMFVNTPDGNQELYGWNKKGIGVEDINKFLEYENIDAEKLRKFDTNSTLRGSLGNKEVYLHVTFDEKNNPTVICTPYEKIGKFSKFNKSSYAYYLQDDKYGLLEREDGKISVFKEHTQEQPPVFGDAGFSFGTTDYVTDEAGDIKELQHDYDSLTLIEGTELYYFKKGDRYGLAQNNGGTITGLLISEEVSDQIPTIYDTYMVVTLVGGGAKIFDLTTLTKEGMINTLGDQIGYTIEPKHLKNEFFTIKEEDGFYILGPHNNYKPQTKYRGTPSTFKNNTRMDGYVRMQAADGTADWILYDLHTKRVNPRNPLLFHTDEKTDLTRINDLSRMKKGTVILGQSGVESGLFLLYKDQLVLVHKGDVVYSARRYQVDGEIHVLYETQNTGEEHKVLKLVEDEHGYFTASITTKAYKYDKLDYNKYRETGFVRTSGFLGGKIDREEITIPHEFMEDESFKNVSE